MLKPSFTFKKAQGTTNWYGDRLPSVDKKRIVAVYVRQSDRDADDKNGESRETQLKLIEFAAKLLGMDTIDNARVVLYDEGAGKSGQKRIDERPKLNLLYSDLRANKVGTIVVAREDRLFRDKHGEQVGMFTSLAEKLNVVVIVPPLKERASLKLYDFTVYEHLKDFQEKMRIAYDFIEYHVGYMHLNQRNKAARGGYDGRPLVPGLVIPKYIDKANRTPVIYEPWARKMEWVYCRLKELDWNTAKLNREIDKLPYLFPDPSGEDLSKFYFKNNMKKCVGGYKPGDTDTVRAWFKNVSLIGWWLIGKKTGEVIPDNHPAIFTREEFEEAYTHITGYNLDGELVVPLLKKQRYNTRITRGGGEANALLHGLLNVVYEEKKIPAHVISRYGGKGVTYYTAQEKITNGIYKDTVFVFSSTNLDEILVERLRALAKSDSNVASRIEAKLRETLEKQEEECMSIDESITAFDASIGNLKKRIKDLNAKSSGSPDEEEVINDLWALMQEKIVIRDELILKKNKMGLIEGMAEVREFYNVLDEFDAYWSDLSLKKKKKFVSLMVQNAKVQIIGMHWLELTIEWSSLLYSRPDKCLLWSYYARKTPDFTEEVDNVLREHYHKTPKIEIAKLLPNRTWNALQERASQLGLKRAVREFNIEGYGEKPYPMTWLDIAPNGKFLFDTQERTIKIIGDILGAMKKVNRKVYPIWLMPFNPQEIPVAATEGGCAVGVEDVSRLTHNRGLVSLYPESTGADWDARVHVDVIPTKCTIEVDGRVIMRDGQFTL